MSYPVLVDTSAFHALQNAGDAQEHEIAKRVAEELQAHGAILVTTDYILDETYTLLRSILGHKVAVWDRDHSSRSSDSKGSVGDL